MTESQVFTEFGQPTTSNDLTLEQGMTLPEIYIEVHNTYHPNDPTIHGTVIRACHWDRLGHAVVVLFHKQNETWTALNAFRFDDGVKF